MEQEIERIEKSVDRILRDLGSAPPPAGMEVRLMHRVHARTAAPPASRIVRPVWLGFAAGLLCLLFGSVCSMTMHLRSAPKTSSAALEHLPAIRLHVQRTVTPPLGHSIPVMRVYRRHHEAHSQSTNETASFPAPPMPLTQQERLLVIVAQQRNPKAMALLNQHTQEIEMARNKAAFAAFFYQPTEEEMERHAEQN